MCNISQRSAVPAREWVHPPRHQAAENVGDGTRPVPKNR